jgi:hypothetical protein
MMMMMVMCSVNLLQLATNHIRFSFYIHNRTRRTNRTMLVWALVRTRLEAASAITTPLTRSASALASAPVPMRTALSPSNTIEAVELSLGLPTARW